MGRLEPRRAGIAALVSVVVATAGCGGSSTAPAERPRLTQAEFALKANAICRSYGAELKGITRRVNRLVRRRKFEAAVLGLGEARRPLRMLFFRLSRLQPPLGQERRFRELIRLGNKDITYLRGVFLTLSVYDFPQARVLLRRAQVVEHRSNVLARSLGLRGCSR